VNGVGYESGNSSITAGRSLPWLQDVAEQEVWASWSVTYRDVVILDREGNVHDVYNLTEHDLSIVSNYETLKEMLLEAAAE